MANQSVSLASLSRTTVPGVAAEISNLAMCTVDVVGAAVSAAVSAAEVSAALVSAQWFIIRLSIIGTNPIIIGTKLIAFGIRFDFRFDITLIGLINHFRLIRSNDFKLLNNENTKLEVLSININLIQKK